MKGEASVNRFVRTGPVTPKYIVRLGSHRVFLAILSLLGCDVVLLGKQF
jgi:hypothetical protein